jgi:hypothetical protein
MYAPHVRVELTLFSSNNMGKILSMGILCLTLCFSFSCSQKQIEVTPQKSNSVTLRGNKSASILGTAAHNFVNTFYNSTSYTVGRQVNTTVDSQILTVSEIILSGEVSARGYIVTNKVDNAPLYFADVDREAYNMTSVDIRNNDMRVWTNINQGTLYNTSNQFDFIEIVLQDNENPGDAETRRFWGWDVWEYTPCENGRRSAVRTHYVFWTMDVSVWQTGVGCDQTLSNDYYGSAAGSFTVHR